MKLTDLKDRHKDETIYIIGSGKTVEFYNPEFFSNKRTISVNDGWSHWLPRVDFMVTKYHCGAREWAKSDRIGHLLVSRGDSGQFEETIDDGPDYIVFDHAPNKVVDFSAEDFPDDGLVVSYSTITSAMHLAVLMGAAHIVMVGADCAFLDDHSAIEGHPPTLQTMDFAYHFDIQNRIVANEIRLRFGTSVTSLLPFVTPNMEGHKFISPFGALNDS
jgi:hypothetical protein